jgi:hypothetical protein
LSLFSDKLLFSSFFPEWSDRYNNLQAAFDGLREVANNSSPHAIGVAFTIALEHLKKDELKREGPDSRN